LEILKHKHEWVAKQQVQIDVAQQISVITALEQAEKRVIDVQAIETLETPRATADLQRIG